VYCDNIIAFSGWWKTWILIRERMYVFTNKCCDQFFRCGLVIHLDFLLWLSINFGFLNWVCRSFCFVAESCGFCNSVIDRERYRVTEYSYSGLSVQKCRVTVLWYSVSVSHGVVHYRLRSRHSSIHWREQTCRERNSVVYFLPHTNFKGKLKASWKYI
jgi:hypothetical protein